MTLDAAQRQSRSGPDGKDRAIAHRNTLFRQRCGLQLQNLQSTSAPFPEGGWDAAEYMLGGNGGIGRQLCRHPFRTFSVCAGTHAISLPEETAIGLIVVEAAVDGNIDNGGVGVRQQRQGSVQPQIGQILLKADLHGVFEEARKAGGTHVHLPGQFLHGKALLPMLIQPGQHLPDPLPAAVAERERRRGASTCDVLRALHQRTDDLGHFPQHAQLPAGLLLYPQAQHLPIALVQRLIQLPVAVVDGIGEGKALQCPSGVVFLKDVQVDMQHQQTAVGAAAVDAVQHQRLGDQVIMLVEGIDHLVHVEFRLPVQDKADLHLRVEMAVIGLGVDKEQMEGQTLLPVKQLMEHTKTSHAIIAIFQAS